jgi:5'-phosphate synthase pdxT subunit
VNPTIGILALQGAFGAHELSVRRLGADTLQVRTPDDLDRVDALVMPGGESTTMSHLLATSQLFDPIAKRLADDMPTFGTCAGMILLSTHVHDAREDQRSFASLDVDVRRNAYGRQVDSFEVDLDVAGLEEPFHAMFIRAPRVERVGPGVEVLAEHDGVAVLVRQGPILAASFHPELTDDSRIHERFLTMVKEG